MSDSLMKQVTLAMKSKDFSKVIELCEESKDEEKSYEFYLYAGKSYFEQKEYPKSRECYVKAVGIDKEREQGHKGIVEVGFDDVAARSSDGAEGFFMKEHVIQSVKFLLEKASEIDNIEKQKYYLEKLCEGYATYGEHLEAAKAFRDLGNLMLKENIDASSAIIKAATVSYTHLRAHET